MQQHITYNQQQAESGQIVENIITDEAAFKQAYSLDYYNDLQYDEFIRTTYYGNQEQAAVAAPAQDGNEASAEQPNALEK